MIIFIYGRDTYRSKAQLSKMVEKFRVERDPQGLNVVRIDCHDTKQQIMQEIFSAPFLAEKRMVVLEHLISSKQVAVQDALLKRIEEQTIPEDIILIVWEDIEKPKTKLGKELLARLQKETYVQYFEELSGVKLTGWILAEVQDRGGNIDHPAANVLSQSLQGDMWALSSLIDQLVSYTNGRSITIADTEHFIEESVDDNVFTLVDAIVNKQTSRVYTMMQEQYRQGQDAGYIFAMITRQFRILLQLRDLYDRGENLQSSSLAKELKLHPFVIKKSLPMVKRYQLQELKDIHSALLDIDRKTKTGQGDQSMMLDLFVGSLT